MQGTAQFHHQVADALLPQTDAVLHDTTALDAAVHVLDPQPARVERLVDVRISLPHAKRLLAILSDQLTQYESNVGFIPLPAD